MEPDREQAYQRRIAELEAQVAQLSELVAKLSKNSSNSSKPPSSDIVKPPTQPSSQKSSRGNKKRKIGGQPGHPKHDRKPFEEGEVNQFWEYHMDQCPDCGSSLRPSRVDPRIVQQIEIAEAPVRIEEHRALGFYCAKCRKVHYATLPAEVKKAGLVGPRLTALVAYLKCACHASFSTIRKFLRDVLNVTISRGQLVKVIQKVSQALKGVYDELLARLPGESQLNVDETGHKENGKRYWTWCSGRTYTPCSKSTSRGAPRFCWTCWVRNSTACSAAITSRPTAST